MKKISLSLSPLNFKGLVEDIQQTIVKFGLELRREVGARDPFVIDGHGSAARGSLLKTQNSFLSFHYLSHLNNYMELLGKRTFILSMTGKASCSGCAYVSSVILGFILPQAHALFQSSEIHGRLLSNTVISVQNAPPTYIHLCMLTHAHTSTHI